MPEGLHIALESDNNGLSQSFQRELVCAKPGSPPAFLSCACWTSCACGCNGAVPQAWALPCRVLCLTDTFFDLRRRTGAVRRARAQRAASACGCSAWSRPSLWSFPRARRATSGRCACPSLTCYLLLRVCWVPWLVHAAYGMRGAEARMLCACRSGGTASNSCSRCGPSAVCPWNERPCKTLSLHLSRGFYAATASAHAVTAGAGV